jgi:uncharacterized protein YjdB
MPRKTLPILLLLSIAIPSFGQIIADHTVVDKYADIPEYYLEQVKRMLFVIAGESHSRGYTNGLESLEEQNANYAVNYANPPEAPTSSYLRLTHAVWGDVDHSTGWQDWIGEEDWYTSSAAISQIKTGITYCYNNNREISAIGFGWCYDGGMTSSKPYLAATQQYIDYCKSNGYSTKVYFTTGPVDDWNSYGETGYLKSLLHDSIRNYVKADPSRILFDYADILCYDNGGSTPNTATYNGHTFPIITPTNDTPDGTAHISSTGELRLAKALWWMLARIAGWDGIKHTYVSNITVTGAGGATAITTDDGTLQLAATVTPDNATEKTVTWTIADGTGHAAISSTGLVTAISNGTVVAKATANDGSGIYGTLTLTLSNQTSLVTGITVSGSGGATTISTNHGTLQLTASVSPSNASDKSVTWSVTDGTGHAAINSSGLVSAVANGTVVAKATANDGSGVSGTLTITISNQIVPVTGITVTSEGGATTISTDKGTLQLTATVLPEYASNKTVTWSIQSGTGQATISNSGLVTAVANGTVIAKATANDGSGVSGTLTLTLSNQVVLVTGITVTGAGGASLITTLGGTLQLSASVLPDYASDKTVTWSLQNGTGQATINTSGLVTAVANGTVVAKASANDGSGISGTLTVVISDQVIPVTGIVVTGAAGATTITTDNGTLQLSASVAPGNASDKTCTWSIQDGTGHATINSSGLVTAESNGTVIARATANDGSGVYGTLTLTLSNQTVLVSHITLTGAGGVSTISTYHGTLQMTATVTPDEATNKNVIWSIQDGTGSASISASGLVTAVSDGTVTARATASDGSGVYGTYAITITGQTVLVSAINITATGGASTITSYHGTLQLTAVISPNNAQNKNVTWSILNGTGSASISTSGLVTAISNGTVTARATSDDGSGVYGTYAITISGQIIMVSGITVTGTDGNTSITGMGTLQLIATVSPANAANKTVTWSIQDGTGHATISASGLVTAASYGTVIAKATANDGSGVYGTLTITITEQAIPITAITITSAGGATTVEEHKTLQLTANITPGNASNKAITWSVQDGTGSATINATGLVTGVSAGTVTARASAKDGSGVSGSLTLNVTQEIILVSSITVTGEGGATTISGSGTLQLTANILPSEASNKSVTWSILDGTGHATISSQGLVTALSNGTVMAKATAKDGSGITGSLILTISGISTISVESIVVFGKNFAHAISDQGGTLQLFANIFPTNATNKSVSWSIDNGNASISSTGLLKAQANGNVTVKAMANDGSGKTGTLTISITNQLITGVTDAEGQKPVVVSMDDFRILVQIPEERKYDNISLYNILGSLLISENLVENEYQIDKSSLKPGVHIIVLSGEQEDRISLKIVVH